MRLSKLIIAVLCLEWTCLMVWPSHLEGQFVYINSTPQQVQRFDRHISGCSSGTRAFASLLGRLQNEAPLRAQLLDSMATVFFGTPSDLKSREPLLSIDLGDVDRLPTAEAVRTWEADSSWAWTVCELLAHEIGEAISYRDVWRRRPSDETALGAGAWLGERRRAAHLQALQVEDEVASEQRTRVRKDGTPYSRTAECFASKQALIVFGDNTEVLRSGSGPPKILFFPGQDLCASL